MGEIAVDFNARFIVLRQQRSVVKMVGLHERLACVLVPAIDEGTYSDIEVLRCDEEINVSHHAIFCRLNTAIEQPGGALEHSCANAGLR